MPEGATILDCDELPSCSDWGTVNSVFGIPKELTSNIARKMSKALTTHRLLTSDEVINAKRTFEKKDNYSKKQKKDQKEESKAVHRM